MADPVIVPPTPSLTQTHGADTSPGLEQVQRAFDQVLPPVREPEPKTKPPPPISPPPVPAPPPPQAPKPETPPPPTVVKEEQKIPSFLEEALKSEPAAAAPPKEAETEWSEELPPEEKRSRIKGLRDAYNNLKKEMQTLRERPQTDPEQQKRLSFLESQNRQMSEILSRVGVEQSAEFQQHIMQPLYASWNEAARIVKESGADPNELAKAMTLSGRSQFEALDSLFSEMPESAKAEAHDALRTYRRYEDARRAAVANAPRTLEGIRQRETERQYQEVTRQREEMKGMFERAVSRLRDEMKLEVFLKSNDPEHKWWNEQGERIIQQGNSLFLENTDLDRVALACLLAPAAEAYRNLFIKSQKKVSELQKVIDEKIGNEPVLSESGGSNNINPPDRQLQEDLKKPFTDVFLREFHKSQARSR